eukprot:gene13559-20190_t
MALELNGALLVPPTMHVLDPPWEEGQKFNVSDDPDRTVSHAWIPPDFIGKVGANEQGKRTTVDELPVLEAAGGVASSGGTWAKVVHRVLEEEHCAALIDSVNVKGFTPALLNIGRGEQKLLPSIRDGHRVIVDSPELSAWLFQVLQPYIPPVLENGSRLVGLNERCRFLCYTPGQEFAVHTDGKYTRSHPNPRAGDYSYVTLQLYLHDVPVENGGATTFYPNTGEDFYRSPSRHSPIPCQPKAGSVLIFTQDLPHEGSMLQAGIKYTMRTEAMYSPVDYGRASDY